MFDYEWEALCRAYPHDHAIMITREIAEGQDTKLVSLPGIMGKGHNFCFLNGPGFYFILFWRGREKGGVIGKGSCNLPHPIECKYFFTNYLRERGKMNVA